ncbi:MAG: hypothetical protein Q4D38_12020 [Planctomycetia bacterium]|nr:hypothetical protein [Planctomycetia bacterium]
MSTTYTASTNCSFTRVHICQYCGEHFEYRVDQFCHGTGDTSDGAHATLVNVVKARLEHYQTPTPCPNCQMYQVSMLSQIFSTEWLMLRILVVLGVAAFFAYNVETFEQYTQAQYVCLGVFTLEILFQFFWIYKYTKESPNALQQRLNLDADRVVQYAQARRWYRSATAFLPIAWCSFFLPYGIISCAVGLIVYYLIICASPKYIRSNTLPLLAKETEFKV